MIKAAREPMTAANAPPQNENSNAIMSIQEPPNNSK
jgi:hypothetical protein